MSGRRSDDISASDEVAFGEGELVVVVAAVWVAAMLAVEIDVVVVAAAGLVACVVEGRQRRLLIGVALVLLASLLGARAEARYTPAESVSLDGEPALLVTDTEPTDFGWRSEARIDATGQRVRVIGAGFDWPDLVAGQRVLLTGRLGPSDASDWEKSRHLVGVVTSAAVVPVGDVAWFRRPGEWLRAGVMGATSSFGEEHAALYHGLVIGDDRFQGVGQRAQFRAAGLSHLLAVSGQNVSFLLVIAAPITGRLRPVWSFSLIACLLVVFALATRLEPSVLRATMTAGVSTLAAMRSARSAGLRSLSIAVTTLLLIDPFLVWSIGFRLSVGASLGILIIGPLVRDKMPGPDWVAVPASITIAAQLGVSPMLLWVFGPVGLVTVPANLLAGWAAGAVMTLGLSVGLVAALMPAAIGNVLQLPARCLVWWIDAVAAEAAVAPLPAVSAGSLPWLMVSVVLAWWLRPRRWLPGWWLAPLVVVVMATSRQVVVIDGWFAGTSTTPSVLVIEDSQRRWPEAIIEGRVRSIDVVIVADGGWAMARAVDRIRDVATVGVVLAPADHRIVGGRRVIEDRSVMTSAGRIDLVARPSELEINVVVGAGADDG